MKAISLCENSDPHKPTALVQLHRNFPRKNVLCKFTVIYDCMNSAGHYRNVLFIGAVSERANEQTKGYIACCGNEKEPQMPPQQRQYHLPR